MKSMKKKLLRSYEFNVINVCRGSMETVLGLIQVEFLKIFCVIYVFLIN